jgi:hypothetical protein
MVTQPYWDFMLDADLGPKWFDSPVYQEDWYGTVDNPESDHGRVRGRFRNVTTIYDGDNAYPNAHHNPYGYITGEYDLTNTDVLVRTNRFCGYRNSQPFPSCGNLQGCFENYTTLAAFDRCMEDTVHANLHGLHGGQLLCGVDLHEHFATMSYLSDDLKNFVTATMSDVTGKWKSYFKYYACPVKCGLAEPMSTCQCKNTLGLDSVDDIKYLNDTQVYEYVEDALYYLAFDSYMGSRFMWRNPTDHKSVPRDARVPRRVRPDGDRSRAERPDLLADPSDFREGVAGHSPLAALQGRQRHVGQSGLLLVQRYRLLRRGRPHAV